MEHQNDKYLEHTVVLSHQEYGALRCALGEYAENHPQTEDQVILGMIEATDSAAGTYNAQMIIEDVLVGMGWLEFKIIEAKKASDDPKLHKYFIVLGKSMDQELWMTGFYSAAARHISSIEHYKREEDARFSYFHFKITAHSSQDV